MKEIVLKPMRQILAPFIIPHLRKSTFEFKKKTLSLTYHRHGATWSSERALEISIAKFYLDYYSEKSVLEIGNVTSQYFDVQHLILDKYEEPEDTKLIIDQDIIEFTTEKKFNLIISISTIEHIGFDDDGESREKIPLAILKCRKMLKPDGILIMTVPLGYNPDMDKFIANDSLGWRHATYFRRYAYLQWSQCNKEEALRGRYGTPFPYGNCIMVAEFNSKN
tara:strand:+ start:56001 stop:56666 length:666 start_codon:yes stop_codon:yes gene_type:complete